MSFVEFIGFIISILALFYLFFKQQSLARNRREHSEVYKHEESMEEDPFKELMQALGKETSVRGVTQTLTPPPPPHISQQPKRGALTSPLQNYRLTSQIEKWELKSSLENRLLKTKLAQRFEEKGVPAMAQPLHPLVDEVVETKPSRAQVALYRLSSRRDLVIYQEIIDKPKSMRPFP